jgi:hypothetical protein
VPLRVKRGKSINFREPLLNEKTINVPQIKQEQPNWCWAACAEMILRYYDGSSVRQCELANELFGETECCSKPTSPGCNRPCKKQDVSKLYSSKNIYSKLVEGVVPFSKLQSEIDADRPVEVAYSWNDRRETGHLVIVRGWRIDGKEEFVYVNDPGDSPSEERIVAYPELLAAYGKGNWVCTWIEIRR